MQDVLHRSDSLEVVVGNGNHRRQVPTTSQVSVAVQVPV